MSRIFKSKYLTDVQHDISVENTAPRSRSMRAKVNQFERLSFVVSPAQTLRQISLAIEQHYGFILQDCQFYLQDRVQLKPDSPLSSHCVQLNGLVQLILEIKWMPTHGSHQGLTRLNVVDICLPNDNNEFSELQFAVDNINANKATTSHQTSRAVAAAAAVLGEGNGADVDFVSSGIPLPTNQEYIFVPLTTVCEAFGIASHAISLEIEQASLTHTPQLSSSYGTDSSLYAATSVFPSPTQSQAGSSYARMMLMGRMSGSLEVEDGGGSGGKWIIDGHYRRLMEMNGIPRDPGMWNATQVVMWINWASKQFHLIDIGTPVSTNNSSDVAKLAKSFEYLRGEDLLALSLADVGARLSTSGSSATPNIPFYTHFELMKSYRDVCVPYKPQPQSCATAQSSSRLCRQAGRSRIRNSRTAGTNAINNGAARFPVASGYRRLDPKGGVFSPSLPLTSNLRLNGGSFQPRIGQFSASSSQQCGPQSTSAIPSFPSFTSTVAMGSTGEGFYRSNNTIGLLPVNRIYSPFHPTRSTTTSSSSGNYRVVSTLSPSYHQDYGSFATSLQSTAALSGVDMSPVSVPELGNTATLASAAGSQVQLWQFLLDLLTDWRHWKAIHWVSEDGEFELCDPELVASMWGQRKNKPAMNYEKLSRALRYYYDGDMISKVQGKRFVYKFICDLKTLLGFNAAELYDLVTRCANKNSEKSQRECPRERGFAYDGDVKPRHTSNLALTKTHLLSSTQAIFSGIDSSSASPEGTASLQFLGEDEDVDEPSFEYPDSYVEREEIAKAAAALLTEPIGNEIVLGVGEEVEEEDEDNCESFPASALPM